MRLRLRYFISFTAFFALIQIVTQAQSGNSVLKPAEDYTYIDGHLKFTSWHQLFSNLKMNEVHTDTIFIFNDWESSMQISFNQLPPFISIIPKPSIIPPKEGGFLLVTYDAAKRNDLELVMDRIEMITNDTLNPVKNLDFVTVIYEDFSRYSLRDLRNSPVGKLDTNNYDFGTTEQGSIVRYNLMVSNVGKDTLHLRKIKSTCGCTTGEPDKRTLLPGESTRMQVSFNTFGRTGFHSKSVTIITNDPENSHLIFNIGGNIER